MSASGLHIAISAEPVFHFGQLTISNSILTSLIVSGLLIAFAIMVRLSLKPANQKPQGLQNIAEWMIEALYNLAHSVTGSHKKARLFFPIFASFFLFILFNNWLGLVPGVGTIGYLETEPATEVHVQSSSISIPAPVAQASTTQPTESVETTVDLPTGTLEENAVVEERTIGEPAAQKTTKFVPYLRAGTADLNTTLALAIVSVFMTQVFGVMHLKLSYFSKFINFSSPIAFFIGALETVLEFAKIISFAFRLFGNIFAGEVLLAVISFLVPVVVPMPFYGLEVVVGVIQALVFSMLSLVFFNMATIGHDDH